MGKSVMPAHFGLWQSVFGLLVQCGYGHGKEKMAGVEGESQFESKIKYPFGAVDGSLILRENTLECCTKVVAYATSLTEKPKTK